MAAPVLIQKSCSKLSCVPTREQFTACTSAEDVATLEPPTTMTKTFKCFNLVSLLAFLTKTLMKLDSLDPQVLGFATVEAIRAHTTHCAVAGLAPGNEDTSTDTITEEGASLVFIIQFLWLLETKDYTVDPVNMSMSSQAGDWAQRQHTQWIAQPKLPGAHPPGFSSAAIAQQLGNIALAINRNSEDRATCEFLASQQPSTLKPSPHSLTHSLNM